MDIRDLYADLVVPIPEVGCWIWLGNGDEENYGRVPGGHFQRRAHRVSWETSVGRIPRGAYICHSCDTTLCVNPAHLFVGTAADNARDREAKGRRTILTRAAHGMAKLTEEEVGEIREIYAAGGYSQHRLAREYGVCQATIFYVLKNITWVD